MLTLVSNRRSCSVQDGAGERHDDREHHEAVHNAPGSAVESHTRTSTKLELWCPIGRIDVEQYCPNARYRILDDNPFIPIRRPYSNAVAAYDTIRDQRTRGASRLVPELMVAGAVRLMPHHKRLGVAEACDSSSQIRANRFA
jgi:hypothetical protein